MLAGLRQKGQCTQEPHPEQQKPQPARVHDLPGARLQPALTSHSLSMALKVTPTSCSYSILASPCFAASPVPAGPEPSSAGAMHAVLPGVGGGVLGAARALPLLLHRCFVLPGSSACFLCVLPAHRLCLLRVMPLSVCRG